MKYSIVIPCYNEEKNLPNLIQTLKKFPEGFDVEFILVENGSTDQSRMYMKKIEQEKPDTIHFVWVDKNQGYGYGIQQGLKTASGDYVGWIHADMQMDPLRLATFFKYIENHGKDEKLFLKGYRKNRKKVEYFFSFWMGVFESCLFHIRMQEVMSMPFIIPREMLDNIDDWPKDFSNDIYVYVKAKKRGYKTVHIQVSMKDRVEGESSWNTGIYSRIKQSWKMIKASIMIYRSYKDWGS